MSTNTICVDCDPVAEQPIASQTPSAAAKAHSANADDLLDADTFVPPDLTEELPRLVIEYCDRCRWQHRATWVQTELLLTFPTTSPKGLKAITVVPRTAEDTGGRFRVWLYREADVVGERGERCKGAELVWDRKIEGRFPEMKELKQRIRNLISPEQNLGHSDKGAFGSKAGQTAASTTAGQSAGGGSSTSIVP